MNRTVAFFTEGNWAGKPYISSIGRTDINWMRSLNAEHWPITSFPILPPSPEYDIGIYIVPKKNPKLTLEFLQDLKQLCQVVGVMQEASQDNYQDLPVDQQLMYLNFLGECDFILCHNEIDLKYYQGLFPDKNVNIMPTLMLTDNIDTLKLSKDKRGTMIGGTLCKWYSGIDSFIIASDFDEPVFCPSMGRKQEYEDYLEDITYLPYKDWTNWMYDLSKCKYAVHLMRTYAAGSFPLNCAYLQIPCIGWNNGTDTQRLLFPELSPDEGDMMEARKVAKHLKTNKLFFDHVNAYAHKVYLEEFSENIFLNKMSEIFDTY